MNDPIHFHQGVITFFPTIFDNSFLTTQHPRPNCYANVVRVSFFFFFSLFLQIMIISFIRWQFLLQCGNKKHSKSQWIKNSLFFIQALCPTYVARILWSISSSFMDHNWMLSLQLGKLMVVLAAEKRYSEVHTGSSKHLTDSDMYHFGSLIFFFFPLTSHMPTS